MRILFRIALRVSAAALFLTLLSGADLSSYRDFRFGMTVAQAAKIAEMSPADATVAHQRPAVFQVLAWHPHRIDDPKRITLEADTVKEVLLCFFKGELYRMVVTYDRSRVEGMTVEDMIQAISMIYGPGSKLTETIPYRSNYGEVASVLARWEVPNYSCDLIRTGDQSSFAMVLYAKRIDTLAQAAMVKAVRLDELAAPQTELDRQNVKREEERTALEATRSVNKTKFRP